MNYSLQQTSTADIYTYRKLTFDFSQVHDDFQRSRMIAAVDSGLTVANYGRLDQSGNGGTGVIAPGLQSVVAALTAGDPRTIHFYDDKAQMLSESNLPASSGDTANGLTDRQGGNNIWVSPNGSRRLTDPDGVERSTYPAVLNDTWHELTHASGIINHDILNPDTTESNAFRSFEQQLGTELSPVAPSGAQPYVTDPATGKNYTLYPEEFASNDELGNINAQTSLFLVDSSQPVNVSDETVMVAANLNAAAVINGVGNRIEAAAGTTLTLEDTTDNSETTYNRLVDGSGDSVYGSGITVNVNANTAVTLTGSSDVLTGSSGDSFNVFNSALGAITVNLNGGGNEYAGLIGGSDVVNGDVATDGVALTSGTSATINGSGGSIGILGTGINVIASNEIVGTVGNTSFSLIGNDDGIGLGANSYVALGGLNNTVYDDTAGERVDLVSNATATLEGSGGYVGICGTAITATASGDTVATIADASFNLVGSNDGVSVANGSVAAITGGANIINTGANTEIGIAGTNGSFDTVNATNDAAGGVDENGSPTGIYLAPNAQVNLIGSGNLVGLGNGDSLGAYGGGNTIDTYSGDLVVAGQTNGNFDTIYATADAGGGVTANGQGTGIALNSDAQVNLIGSDNQVGLATGDSLGAYGGGNSIYTGTRDLVVAGQTNGNFDTIYATGDAGGGLTANGQGTGIDLSNNSQVNLMGSGNQVGLGTGDSLGAYGGGNLIYTGAGDLVVAGQTNGNFDTIYATADAGGGVTANGQGTGIDLNNNSQVNLIGTGNQVGLGTGDSLGAYGGGNSIYSGSNDFVVAGQTGGNYDQIYANGDLGGGQTSNGQPTGISLNDNTQARVVGNNDTTYLGAGDALGERGNGDTVNAGSTDATTIVGDSDIYNGSGGAVGITGSNEVVNASYENVTFGAHTSSTGSESHDTIGADGYNTLNLSGSSDKAYGNNDSINFSGGTDDSVSGTGDSGSGYSTGDGSDPFDNPDPSGLDPIILNLDGNAVQTQSLSTSGAYFDMQNDGIAVHTGWMTAGEGMLVYDPLSLPVTQEAQLVAGFDALSHLADKNGGALDASNLLFDQLRVWIDPTGDGQFRQQDLHTLQDLGIASINLSSKAESANSNGNTILNDSTFTWNGGITGDVAGVKLSYTAPSVADTYGTPISANPSGLAALLTFNAGSTETGVNLAAFMVGPSTPAGFDLAVPVADDPALSLSAVNTHTLAVHAM